MSQPQFENSRWVCGVMQTLREWAAAVVGSSDVDGLGPRDLERIASDVGLTANELRSLARYDADSADLLPRMLARLQLDAKAIADADILLFRDLQRVCTTCESKKQCAHDLADPQASSAWQSYCPNSLVLADLLVVAGRDMYPAIRAEPAR